MGRSVHQAPAELTWDEAAELVCGPYIGPNWPDDRDDSAKWIPERSNFRSDEERREAWFYHRDELIAKTPDWTRPWGFWRYECAADEPDDRAEVQRLIAEHG